MEDTTERVLAQVQSTGAASADIQHQTHPHQHPKRTYRKSLSRLIIWQQTNRETTCLYQGFSVVIQPLKEIACSSSRSGSSNNSSRAYINNNINNIAGAAAAADDDDDGDDGDDSDGDIHNNYYVVRAAKTVYATIVLVLWAYSYLVSI